MAPPTEHPGPGRRTQAEVEILAPAFNILDEVGTKAARIDRQDHLKRFVCALAGGLPQGFAGA